MPAKHSRAAKSGHKASYHHGNLREALVQAAIDILAKEGVAALGLRSAARAAGVSAAAPYHHFGSKEGLLAAVATEGFGRLTASQYDAEGGTPVLAPRERMKRLAIAYIHFARRNPELYQLMFGRIIEDREEHPELVAAANASYQHIESATRDHLQERADDSLTVKLALNGGWSMVHGLSTLLNDGKITPGEDGNPEEEELIATVAELWCRGVERGLQDWSWSDDG